MQGRWILLVALLSATEAQPLNCTIPAKTFPALRALINNANSSLISHRMKSFVVDVLLDESWGELLVGECVAQNNLNISNDTIQANETDWVLHFNNPLLGLNGDQNAVLNSTAAKYLDAIANKYRAAIVQTFVSDAQGVLVGATNLTNDFWQRDEPKWIEAFNSCFTGVHISPEQHDFDAGGIVQFVGLPIISDQNFAVGTIAWGLREASLPCTADGPTLADLRNFVRATSLDSRTQQFVIDVLLPYCVDDYLVAGVRAANNRQIPRSRLVALDALWRSGWNASNFSDPLFNTTIFNEYGDFLRNVSVFYADDRWIGEVQMVDIQGQLVAASEHVDAYFRGDEASFQITLNNCIGGMDVSDLEFDEQDQQWGWRVSLPMTNAENKVLGTISWFLGAPAEPSIAVSAFLDIRDLVMNSSHLSDRAKIFVVDTLLPYITDDVFAEAVKLSNRIGEPLNATKAQDQIWRAAVAAGGQSSLEVQILNSPESVYLRAKLKEIGLGAVYHLFVTDYRGRVVAMDHPTDDYYQGDEPGHIGALNNGHGGIYVDPQARDPETGMLVQVVSLPLLDPHNRVVGAMTFVVAESGVPCQGHALLFHEMAVLINALPVPPVLHAWYLHNILPEAYSIEYETDAENAASASYSIAQLRSREVDWANNASTRDAITKTLSGLALKQLQAEHPALADAWVRGLRGEVVGAIIPPTLYWGFNDSGYVQGFASCNGSVSLAQTNFNYHDEPLRFSLSVPTLEPSNKVRGAITFVVEFPRAQYLGVIPGFPAAALAFSIFTTIAGIAFGVTFALYRKTNLIRMSSPAFLLLSLIGAVVTSWGLYTMVVQPEEGSDAVCQARTFVLPLGFALFFSPLFMKSYRVYRIFEATLGTAPPKKFKSAKFRNKFVFIRVGTFFAVQLALSVLAMILPDRPVFQEDMSIDPESLQRVFTRKCSQSIVFLALTLVYNMGLLIFGAIISVLGRRYPTAFNESIYLMITMNLLASFSLIILFGNSLENIQDVAWLNLLGGHLMLWVGMGLVFGSKVYQIVTGHADDKVTLVIAPTAEKRDSSSSTPPTANKEGPSSGKKTTLELPGSKNRGSTNPSRTETTGGSPESPHGRSIVEEPADRSVVDSHASIVVIPQGEIPKSS